MESFKFSKHEIMKDTKYCMFETVNERKCVMCIMRLISD